MSIETARSLLARANTAGAISVSDPSHAPGMPCPAVTVGHGPNGTMIAGSGGCAASSGRGVRGGGSSSAKN